MRKNTIMCTRNVDFQLETSATPDSDGRTLDGYAAVFDQPTRIRSWEGDFEETISRGAFAKTLRERKPVMQYNHGRDARIGTAPIGTFDTIEEDSHGLHTVGRLFDHSDVERVRQGIQSGDISGMSFTFEVVRDAWTDKDGVPITNDRELSRLLFDAGDRGPIKRTVKEVKLREAGPVLYPAYEGTSVGVRDHEEVELTRDEVAEMYSRTSGLTHESAVDVIMSGYTREQVDGWLAAEKQHDADVRSWLQAETEHNTKTWLEAEATYRWLEAEKNFSDAAARTSEETSSAAEKHPATSHPTKINKRTRMFTLNELRERVAAAEVRMEELATEYRDAELPEAEQAEFDAAEAQLARDKAAIEKIEARLARLTVDAQDPKRIDGAPAAHVGNEIRHDLDELRNEASSTQAYYNKVRDNALRIIEKGNPAVERKHKEDAQERMESLLSLGGRDDAGHTLAERYAVTSSELYERAFFKVAANGGNLSQLSQEEFRAMQLGSDPAGGYAVPVQLDSTIIWTQPGLLNPLRSLAKTVQIVGKEYQGVLSGGISAVQRNAEGAETSDNSFTISNYTVRTKRADAFVPFTYEAEIGWDALRQSISYAIAYAKDEEEAYNFLNGNGTGNIPNGLLGTLDSGSYVATAGPSLATADVYDLEVALDERYRANAHWVAHKAFYQKVRQFDTAGGADLWERIGNSLPNRLLGYPTHESAGVYNSNPVFNSDLTTSGKTLAIFGDFSNFMIVDRIGMNVELIPQVFGANQRPTGQRGIFAVWMNNTKVLVDDGFRVLKTA